MTDNCDQRCDFNDDGIVNELDQEIIFNAFGSHLGDSNWNAACDLNGDGVIDILDTTLFGKSFGCRFGAEHVVSVNIPIGATLTIDGVEII